MLLLQYAECVYSIQNTPDVCLQTKSPKMLQWRLKLISQTANHSVLACHFKTAE